MDSKRRREDEADGKPARKRRSRFSEAPAAAAGAAAGAPLKASDIEVALAKLLTLLVREVVELMGADPVSPSEGPQ